MKINELQHLILSKLIEIFLFVYFLVKLPVINVKILFNTNSFKIIDIHRMYDAVLHAHVTHSDRTSQLQNRFAGLGLILLTLYLYGVPRERGNPYGLDTELAFRCSAETVK